MIGLSKHEIEKRAKILIEDKRKYSVDEMAQAIQNKRNHSMSELKSETLKELLTELAEGDLAEGSNIEDHPCSIAVAYINQLELKESETKAQAVDDMHDGERFGLVIECLDSMSYTDLKLITDKCIELERNHAQQLRDSN